MQLLGLDLGDKRTGVAAGDRETGIVTPLKTIELPLKGANAGERLIGAVGELAREHGCEALVIGLPVNMDGTEGERAKLVRSFGDRLSRELGIPVLYQDERLTSAQADWTMARSGLSRGQKKQRRDALAAAAILRDYLEAAGG